MHKINFGVGIFIEKKRLGLYNTRLPLSTFLFKYIIEHISIAIIQIKMRSINWYLHAILGGIRTRKIIKLSVGFLLPCPTQIISLIFSIFFWWKQLELWYTCTKLTNYH
ncbi:hypothetical protein ACJX0J_018002 [Zea mays]